MAREAAARGIDPILFGLSPSNSVSSLQGGADGAGGGRGGSVGDGSGWASGAQGWTGSCWSVPASGVASPQAEAWIPPPSTWDSSVVMPGSVPAPQPPWVTNPVQYSAPLSKYPVPEPPSSRLPPDSVVQLLEQAEAVIQQQAVQMKLLMQQQEVAQARQLSEDVETVLQLGEQVKAKNAEDEAQKVKYARACEEERIAEERVHKLEEERQQLLEQKEALAKAEEGEQKRSRMRKMSRGGS